MKRVYAVLNGNNFIMAVFTDRRDAKKLVETVGLALWNEQWEVEYHDLNKIERWLTAKAPGYKTHTSTCIKQKP